MREFFPLPSPLRRLSQALLVNCVGAALALAAVPASIQGLGFAPGDTDSYADCISADGSAVSGWSTHKVSGQNVDRAFRWTLATGMLSLGALPGAFGSYGSGINGDGTIIVGNCVMGVTSNAAFRWTNATGLQPLTTPAAAPRFWAFGLSRNGVVAVGQAGSNASSFPAYKWVNSAQGTSIGSLDPGLNAQGQAASADGSVIIGLSYFAPSNPDRYAAVRWTSAGMVSLGTLPGGMNSRGFGTSDDGSVVVGGCSVPVSGAEHAMRWTSPSGMRELGVLSGDDSSYLTAVNANGTVAVGASLKTSTGAYRAVFWNAKQGMVDLRAYLVSKGVDMTGWTLNFEAMGISADGRKITGTATHNGRSEAYIATIPAYCSADLNNDGVVNDEDFALFGSDYNVLLCGAPEMRVFCPCDFNLDWVVDDADFVLFANAYDAFECP